MKKLPNAVKWLIILVVLGAMGAMMWAVNDRASRVEMPAPDNTFGITIRQRVEHNKSTGSFPIGRSGKLPVLFLYHRGRSLALKIVHIG